MVGGRGLRIIGLFGALAVIPVPRFLVVSADFTHRDDKQSSPHARGTHYRKRGFPPITIASFNVSLYFAFAPVSPSLPHSGTPFKKRDAMNTLVTIHMPPTQTPCPPYSPSTSAVSTTSVTGPSLTNATRMCAPNRPSLTVSPCARNASLNASQTRLACSGSPAAMKLGRLPLRMLP